MVSADAYLKQLGIYMIIYGLGFFTFYGLLVVKHPFSFESLIEPVAYGAYSTYDRNDPVVLNITEFCMPFTQPEAKVECVVSRVRSFFHYNHSLVNVSGVRTPTQVKSNGGVCRDYAVMYDSIFTNLKFRTEFTFTENHVFNYIWWGYDLYCVIDQSRYDCYKMG